MQDCLGSPSPQSWLGRVDGFDQDEAEGERDEGTVIARSLLATKGDALEALEFADGLLDARPRFVEVYGMARPLPAGPVEYRF